MEVMPFCKEGICLHDRDSSRVRLQNYFYAENEINLNVEFVQGNCIVMYGYVFKN